MPALGHGAVHPTALAQAASAVETAATLAPDLGPTTVPCSSTSDSAASAGLHRPVGGAAAFMPCSGGPMALLKPRVTGQGGQTGTAKEEVAKIGCFKCKISVIIPKVTTRKILCSDYS